MAQVRGTGSHAMGQSIKTGQLERAQLRFLGAPVNGQPTAFVPMVIRTTKQSFAGADGTTFPLPDTESAPGFVLNPPETDDEAHDLVFIISRDSPLPENAENAIPVIFELPIRKHVWYLHVESQVNKIAAVPSPTSIDRPGLSFVRQNGNQNSMLWIYERAPRT